VGDDVRLAEAFDGWIAAQRAALATMQAADVPAHPTDLAEGYRWVTRLASLAQDWFVEKADPLHPDLFVCQDAYRKLMVDNPDVRYRFAVLDDARRYRLRGTRGEAAYVGLTFGTPIGRGAPGGGPTGTLTQTHLDALDLGPRGEVDLCISPGPRPPDAGANWVELQPGTGQLAVRETFFDRRVEEPARLELLLDEAAPPPVLRPDDLVDRLGFAGLFVQFVAATVVQMWRDTERHVNCFGGFAGAHHVESQEDEVRSHSDADMVYHGGRWVLGDDEALVVTVHPPAAEFLYWGLTVANPWMESYDYRHTTTSLNNRRARNDDDGAWRVAISPRDPGVRNWLDTGGRQEGYMLLRWVLASQDPPHPDAELVPVDRVPDIVP